MKLLLENWRKYTADEPSVVPNREDMVEFLMNNPHQEIHLDNPKGSAKGFGRTEKVSLPFDYGEYSAIINPADNMGWDLIIVPSSNEKDKNLIPVGIVDYHADPEIWKKVGKKMNDDNENNSKIVIADRGQYSQEDKELINNFFSTLVQFKPVVWF